MQITNFQAIIFDFDGVVAESGKIKTQAFAELYRAYGDDIVNKVVDFHVQNGGLSRYHKFRYYQEHYLVKPPLTQDEEKQLDHRFSELVVEAVIAADAVPGANELIHQQASRIPLFVASGTPEIELKVIVEKRGLAPYFKDVRGAPTQKQTLVAEILSQYNLVPETTLMIGDALIDYESADANGLPFLGRVYPGDENPFPSHITVMPDLCHLVT